jgi:hypothetical protein
MKKIAVIYFVAISFLCADSADFELGFYAALKSVDLHFKQDGAIAREVNYTNKHVVYIESKNLPTNEILYLQYMAQRENFIVNITDDKILLGGFERLADATQAVDRAKIFAKNVKLIKNNQNVFNTKPLLSEAVARELTKDGFLTVEKIKVVRVKDTVQTQQQAKTDTKPKWFNLKMQKAQAYEKIGKTNISANFKEYYIAKNGNYKTAEEVKTKDGEVFVKVLNKNIYFLRDDIEYKK